MNFTNTRPVARQRKRSVQVVNAKELPPPFASAKGMALEVIDPDFPNAKVRSSGLQASLRGTPGIGLLPKEDGNNSVAQSAMDLQGMEAERPNIHGMMVHVINLLQAVVERDETARSEVEWKISARQN